VLAGVGKVGLTVLLLGASIGPVIAMIWFAWWFLRAGRRYDERERAARSSSTQGRPPD
jgi:hypothetical protein